MADDDDHGAWVDAWMQRTAKNLPSEDLVRLFGLAFVALFGRAHRTLGDITLTAIADRVIFIAIERFDFLSSLEVDPTGLRCEKLRARAASLDPARLAKAIRFVLVEFLALLGNLTAEILTPPLRAELAKVALEFSDASRGVKEKSAQGSDGGETKP